MLTVSTFYAPSTVSTVNRPISVTKRKATGGPESMFASEFPEEQQSKYLGSYYAVSDFTKINPEFGTLQDLENS